MAITHLLEDFSTDVASGNIMKLVSDVAMEDQRLASFEQGYSAGWEDAVEAQEQDQTRITGNLASSLEDFSFTYHEAITQLLESIEPVFRSLVDLVLPNLMARTIGQHIVEQLGDMARNQAFGPATLVVPLGASAILHPILDQELPMPVRIVEDAEMDSGSAFLRLGSTESVLDSAALLETMRAAIDAFVYQNSEELKNG
jgi:flagellar assembly protein FliH